MATAGKVALGVLGAAAGLYGLMGMGMAASFRSRCQNFEENPSAENRRAVLDLTSSVFQARLTDENASARSACDQTRKGRNAAVGTFAGSLALSTAAFIRLKTA